MANEVLTKVGTQLIFANHDDDFVGGAAGTSLEQAGATDVQIDLTGIADGAAWQSAKADLTATRAREFSVMAALEFAAGPDVGGSVEMWWAPSPDATAGNGNPGGVAGADLAWTGTAAGAALTSVVQLQFIGAFACELDLTGTVQVAYVGTFAPAERYGTLVVFNKSGQAFHSDAVEIHIVFNPIIPEIQ